MKTDPFSIAWWVYKLRCWGVIDWPKGHGKFYDFQVRLRPGKAYEKKLKKVISKALLELPEYTPSRITLVMERLMEHGYFTVCEVVEERHGEYVGGIGFFKCKSIIDKADVGLSFIKYNDVSEHVRNRENHARSLELLRTEEAKAIERQDFEEAAKTRKKIDLLKQEEQQRRYHW